jgi:hypothetical protein
LASEVTAELPMFALILQVAAMPMPMGSRQVELRDVRLPAPLLDPACPHRRYLHPPSGEAETSGRPSTLSTSARSGDRLGTARR